MARGTFFLRRAAQSIAAFFVLATLIFCIFRLLPGNPVGAVSSPEMTEAVRHELIVRFGLDQPVYVQYFRFLKELAVGDFGTSFTYQQPVLPIVLDRAANTATIILPAFVLSYGLGFALGVIAAWKRGTAIDSSIVLFVLGFRSAPMLWTGMMALFLLAFVWPLFPVGGMRSPGSFSFGFEKYLNPDFLWHLTLPLIVSSLYFLGFPAILTRNAMLEVVGEDFIELARAKGQTEAGIMFRHAARNAILPPVTAAAVFIGWAFGGILVLEYVFSWPGLGTEMVHAVGARDYPLAQGCFMFIGILILLSNLVADVLYSWLDPRISQ
ncbi:MAG: ABC transporter permease [Vulcanimicrobiaceae bacterium]